MVYCTEYCHWFLIIICVHFIFQKENSEYYSLCLLAGNIFLIKSAKKLLKPIEIKKDMCYNVSNIFIICKGKNPCGKADYYGKDECWRYRRHRYGWSEIFDSP